MEKTKFAKLKEYAAQLMKFGEEKEAEKKPDTEEEEVKFEAVKIKDGETMVEYNPSLEVGSPVMIAGGTGSTPAPDSTYNLSNGVIFVTKDGKIESVTDTGELEEEKKPDAAVEALMAKVELLSNEVAGFKAMFSKIDFSKIPTKAEITAFSKEVQTFGVQVGAVIEELSAIPVNVPKAVDAEATEKQGVNFGAVAAKFAQQ